MINRSFVDADGDTYTVSCGETGNILLTYKNGEENGVDLFVFKAEDARRMAGMILDAALEARK